jgi:hypothetical protein
LIRFCSNLLASGFLENSNGAIGRRWESFHPTFAKCASSGVGTRLIDFRVWGGEELESEDDEEETENNSRQEEAGRVGRVGIYRAGERGGVGSEQALG